MTKKITVDEYFALAVRYNEQRTINDSLQKEIKELKDKLKKETAHEYNERNRIS